MLNVMNVPISQVGLAVTMSAIKKRDTLKSRTCVLSVYQGMRKGIGRVFNEEGV